MATHAPYPRQVRGGCKHCTTASWSVFSLAVQGFTLAKVPMRATHSHCQGILALQIGLGLTIYLARFIILDSTTVNHIKPHFDS